MIKRVTAYFYRNYFDEYLPLEYRIYMIFFLEALFISTLSATTNTLLGKGLFGLLLQWSYVLLCARILFVPVDVRLRLSKPLLVFITFIYIPFLYFQTAGYDGTALLFSLLGIFLLAIVFKGRQRWLAVGLNVAIYASCALLQYRFPHLVTPHTGALDKLVDLLVALVLSATGLAAMTIYVSNAFEIEKDHIRGLLDELEQSNNALAELTNRDALTGVYNRRYLAEFLDRELETCARTGSHICLLMLDLDHFKSINDTYGHGFGDEVIIGFADAVGSSLRKYDILARMGGEEFVVVLHATGIEVAREIAERARLAVSRRLFRNNVTITASIGLAQSRAGEHKDSLLKRADTCLYRAKHGGRNRVVSEEPPTA